MKILDLILKLKEMNYSNSTIKILNCWFRYSNCNVIIMRDFHSNKPYIYLNCCEVNCLDEETILYRCNYYTSELLTNHLNLIYKNFGDIEVKVPEPIYSYIIDGDKEKFPTGLYDYRPIYCVEFAKDGFSKNIRNEDLDANDILISRK